MRSPTAFWLDGRRLYDVVNESLDGGVTFLQLREKELDSEDFLSEAKEIKALCREYDVPFIINDNVEIAKKIDADGVHVGQSDMEALDVRKTLGPDKIIGVSASTVEQALKAQAHGADYLGWGAVLPPARRTTQSVFPLKPLRKFAMPWTFRWSPSAG